LITDVRIYVIVGALALICIALMVFNLLVIRQSKGQNEPSARKIKKWKAIIDKHINVASGKNAKYQSLSHNRFLIRKLGSSDRLLFYSIALQKLKEESTNKFNKYIKARPLAFQRLAQKYAGKSGVERAFFAEVVCDFPQVAGDLSGQLADILVSFIPNSGIHCRAKVLRALCSIGSAQGVANALRVINDDNLFIHNKLLASELSSFSGNKDELMDLLWQECQKWSEDLKVSIVRFITRFSSRYTDKFFLPLQDSSVDTEVRIAIIRYYWQHKYEPARNVLIGFITTTGVDVNLSIVAASALVLYPSPETFDALRIAMSNPNWYVRHNAASTIFRLDGKAFLTEISEDENSDNFARDVAKYMLKQIEDDTSQRVYEIASRKTVNK